MGVAVSNAAGPTVVRRQLGRRLRQLRDVAGLSVDEVVSDRYLGISRAKLFKLEAGKHAVKPQDIAVLGARYGAERDEIETLQALALATQESSWWHVYGEDAVPEWFSLYVELEPSATAIRKYEAELIPGLLQTRNYAWAVYRAGQPGVEDTKLEPPIEVRMARQTFFEQALPHPLHVVINEAALLRTVGGADVMQEQMARLRQAAERPEITIDVLPLSAGAHAAMKGSFAILDFPDPSHDPSIAYIENASSAAYLQKETELDRYNRIFTQLKAQTIPLQEYSP